MPTRVDWEYRSATGAFPSTYNLASEVLVIKPNTDAFYNAANYPFRRVRFRSDLEREDVGSLQADLKRDFRLGLLPAVGKVGAKYVGREKADDRNN